MKTIKKIMLIILATIFLIMIKSNVCSAYQTHTSQAEYFKGESGLNTILQHKEKAVGRPQLPDGIAGEKHHL